MSSRSGLPRTRINAVIAVVSAAALVVALVEGWTATALLAGASTLLWTALLVLGVRRRRARRQGRVAR